MALGVAGIDGQVARGDLQHGVAHVVQRPDDPAGDGHHGAEHQGECRGQQHELDHQRAQGLGMLDGGVVLGGLERAFGDGDRRTHAADRDRAPLVRGQFGLLAGDQAVEQAIAQSEIVRLEIGGLGRGDRGGKRRRQLHARCRRFQRGKRDFGAAEQSRVGQARFRHHAAGGEPLRYHQRCFAGGIAQQPGGLLDRQQLVDGGVLMVDGGGKGCRQLVECLQQRGGGVVIFLRQRGAARGLWLGDVVPEFLLLRRQLLEQLIELGHQRVLLRKFDRRQQHQCVGHRGHFRIANLPQVFIDVACDGLVGVEQAEGRGLIGSQVVHRLEHVRRGVGDDGDPVRQLQPGP